MRIIRLPDMFGHYSAEYWQDCMTPPGQGLRGSVGEHLLGILREHQPDRTTESHQPMPVILQPGKEIAGHAHPEWTLIYFIDAEDVPLIVSGVVVYPANNTAILLEPLTHHQVMRNYSMRPRLSLALRFSDD